MAIGINSISCGNENRFATASDDGTALIWDKTELKVLGVLKGHTARVNSVAFSNDANKVVTTSLDRKVRIWDLENFSIVVPDIEEKAIADTNNKNLWSFCDLLEWKAACFSPDGKMIATNCNHSNAKKYDSESQSLIGALKEADGYDLYFGDIEVFNFSGRRGYLQDVIPQKTSITFSPDGGK